MNSTEVDMEVTHTDPILRNATETTLLQHLRKHSPPEIRAETTEEYLAVLDFCMDQKQLLERLSCVGRPEQYTTRGYTMGSIVFHMEVYSYEGFRCLKKDIASGLLGRKLAEILIPSEIRANYPDQITLDLILKEENLREEKEGKILHIVHIYMEIGTINPFRGYTLSNNKTRPGVN